jgi:uncharacterized protein
LSTTHLLYLHGFRSSPRSFKAQHVQARLAEHRPDVVWWCPHLPPSPRKAVALVRQGTAYWPAATSAIVGSSLGGFYASVVAAAAGWPSVVVNPAVDPARGLVAYIGEQTAFHADEERLFFRSEYIDLQLLERTDRALPDFDEHLPSVLAFLKLAGPGPAQDPEAPSGAA